MGDRGGRRGRNANLNRQLALQQTAYNPMTTADIGNVYKSIWVGSHKALQSGILNRLGIKYVVNTSRELKRMDVVDWADLKANGIIVMHVPWNDSLTQQIFPGKDINTAIQWLDQIIASGQQVLVNCAAGRSRSVSLVLAYMIVREGFTFEDALAQVRSVRPQSNPNPNFVDQLRNIEHSKRIKDQNGRGKGPKQLDVRPSAGAGQQYPPPTIYRQPQITSQATPGWGTPHDPTTPRSPGPMGFEGYGGFGGYQGFPQRAW